MRTLNPLLRDFNTLDYSLLEPGDILSVANPTDVGLMRYLVFWSHVGVVSAHGDVIDAVREPRGEYVGDDTFFQVHRSPFDSYRLSYDVLALRPKLPAAARREAALYAESKLGTPYSPTVLHILFGRRDTKGYSCASLLWQAYRQQGLDLGRLRLTRLIDPLLAVAVIPLALSHDPQVEIIDLGTRYRPIPEGARRLRWQRRWFKRVLGAHILVDGAPDPPALAAAA